LKVEKGSFLLEEREVDGDLSHLFDEEISVFVPAYLQITRLRVHFQEIHVEERIQHEVISEDGRTIPLTLWNLVRLDGPLYHGDRLRDDLLLLFLGGKNLPDVFECQGDFFLVDIMWTLFWTCMLVMCAE